MQVALLDTTLRDGSHAMSHQFTTEQVARIAGALDRAGIPIIEISHGDGLAGSSIQYGFSLHTDRELLEAAARVVKHSRLGVLLLPGIGTKEDLRMAADIGARVARVATHVTEADISEQHIGLAKEMGMVAIGALMMSHMVPPEKVLEQASLMERYGADAVYVMDSAGAMLPGDVKARVELLVANLSIPVGFHAHNNLGLAVANSMAALDAGARFLDATLRGLGAGAGNTPTEVLVAVLNRVGVETGVDLFAVMDAAEYEVRPLMRRVQEIDRASLSLGYAGVYSSFLLHAERAAARFGVDARDILIELGRRKVVGGQEDMIVQVAVELVSQERAS